jgi:hypothetical protein
VTISLCRTPHHAETPYRLKEQKYVCTEYFTKFEIGIFVVSGPNDRGPHRVCSVSISVGLVTADHTGCIWFLSVSEMCRSMFLIQGIGNAPKTCITPLASDRNLPIYICNRTAFRA